MLKPEKRGKAKLKADAAKARKAAGNLIRPVIRDREEEKRYSQEAEAPKSRSATKREGVANKRAEAALMKAGTRRLAEEEEKRLQENLEKKNKSRVTKTTEVELRRRREEEKAAIQRRVEELKLKQSRMTAQEEYKKTVFVKNTNLEGSVIEAHTVEEAVAQLTLIGFPKASLKAYISAEVVRLKEEKPGLRNDQYNDMATKSWKRSCLNKLREPAEYGRNQNI